MSCTMSRVLARCQPLIITDHLARPLCTTLVYRRPERGGEGWRPGLYVLDKYGTLVNIHRVWTPWVLKVTHRLETSTGLSLEDKLLRSLDICSFTKRVRDGVVGDGTTWQIKQEIEKVLYREGIPWRKSQLLVEQCWDDCAVSDPETIGQLRSVRPILENIKASGAKIAVCSSDVRDVTVAMLEKANLMDAIDHVMCGEVAAHHGDRVGHVSQICNEVGVEPGKTVVIGDTRGDMLMGRAGHVALTVGVLSGIGTRLDLHGVADVITEDLAEAVERVRGLGTGEVAAIARDRPRSAEYHLDRKADLVIFDKDGTLLCFHSLWTPWARTLIQRLEETTGIGSLGDKVLPGLGYSEEEGKWHPAVFTQGTTRQSKDKVKEILEEEGVHQSDTERIVSESWLTGDHSKENESVRPLDDPAAIFKSLQASGIKVAVCTSDCRAGTEQFLADLGADPYVDMVVCGDDPESIPKPDAHNALHICSSLGVDPARTVMVGDTLADMEMGRAAKLGATVAVLSGVGDVGHLAPDADHMVPSVAHVLDVVK